MFVRVKTTPNSPRKSVQIVASVRDDDRVRQKIVRHVGIALNDDELVKLKEVAEFIKAQLEAEHQPNLFGVEQAAQQAVSAKHSTQTKTKDQRMTVDLGRLREQQRTVVGIHEVYSEVYQQLGFDRIWGRSKRWQTRRELLRHITLARIAQPQSKRGSVMTLERDFGVTLNLDSVYKMMDGLDDVSIDKIQRYASTAAQQLLGEPLDVLFYDCTTLYFESFAPDALRQQGFSKDHKAQETQVLLALMVTRDGLPVGYDVFPGATFEGHTLIPLIDALKARFTLNRVVFVADRGLFSEKNLTHLDNAGVEYVVGAKLKTQTAAVQEQILDKAHYSQADDNDLQYQIIERPKGRRLIVSHSQKRARKDSHERQKAVQKLAKKLSKSSQAKHFVTSSTYKKYLSIQSGSDVTVNQAAIDKSAQWDGVLGVVTNVTDETPQTLLAHYRGLWQVEESFRINKHDLKVRPIFHFKASRIRAHLAIAFMAFCCVRHLEYRVKLQYKKLSPEVIRKELVRVQMSLLEHRDTKQRYGLPSAVGPAAEKIYQVMGLKPQTTVYPID